MRPTIYNHSAPAGSRFQTDLPESTIQRMYHSSATLLPDGSVFIAGSNPNADVIDDASNATCSFAFLTPRGALADHSLPEQTSSKLSTAPRSCALLRSLLLSPSLTKGCSYPDYYDEPRPAPTGIPASITYGGANFDLTLPASSVNGTNLGNIKVALIKTGFSTHAMNMGMRYPARKYLHGEQRWLGDDSCEPVAAQPRVVGSWSCTPVRLLLPLLSSPLLSPSLPLRSHASEPALTRSSPHSFVTVDNIPSIGEFIMVGSGTIGTQPLLASTPLKASSGNFGTLSKTGTSDSAGVQAAKDSGATMVGAGWALFLLALAVL